MKVTLFLLGLILASVLLTEAHRKKEKRVIPKKMCKRGIFDDKACKCKCNAIGHVSVPVFCWMNTLLCKTQGKNVPEDCCVDYRSEGDFGLDPLQNTLQTLGN